MDSDSLAAPNTTKAPRKVRFAPKGPPRRAQKTVLPKPENIEADVDAAKAEELMQRFNEASMKVKSKAEKKGPTQVAFGYGGSYSLKSYGPLKGHKAAGSMSDGGIGGQRVQKEYTEPWDYYTNYPVTLPVRRPYSGNPELLDEEEFGEASRSLTYDENSVKPAMALGLMEENLEEKMFFVQLPPTMPMLKQSVKTEGSETATSSKSSKAKACSLNELPGGFMGKMLVYKSGAIKLKLGETLYNVSPGMDCSFAQDVVAVNTEEKYCSNIGELTKRLIITPDVDSILDSI
ncbi:uncharacterized protein LOC132068765 [Lycium ferocissimum]|uniref:uncharacterized protein LOC132068765 n=1 Tax=Lycium ferocissimum TaxID=112874 RepID=UPI00281632F6|nr:uncharacterized protein LOC132068765 [Lycium ferocissimum]XP_059318442.1 uncharacterized protein LOC132068765 [Lycium ferocissimum]XP_059318443.1 uncharacterized protein LOC132068765 [Lycium ferocissimum]